MDIYSYYTLLPAFDHYEIPLLLLQDHSPHLSLCIFPLLFLFLLHQLCCSIYLFIVSKPFLLTLLLPSSTAPESNPVSVFSPAFELHHHHLLNFQRLGSKLPNHLETEGKGHKLWLKMFSLDIRKKHFFTWGIEQHWDRFLRKVRKVVASPSSGVSKTWLNNLS